MIVWRVPIYPAAKYEIFSGLRLNQYLEECGLKPMHKTMEIDVS